MMREESSWELQSAKTYPTLSQNIEADIVIIGAGLVGIFNAYILSKAGLKVVVLESKKEILHSTTLVTTAFITKIIDSSYEELITLFGKENARLIWQSGQDAIDCIADIIENENIDCEFKFVKVFTYAKDYKQFTKLTKEYEAIKESGIEAALWKDGSSLHFKNSGFMEISDQATFHPLKFGYALADLAESAGAKIFTDSEVLSIENLTVKIKDYQVQATDILLATHYPFINKGTQFKKSLYVSYVYELEIAKGLIREGLYLDMDNPYHYFKIDSFENFDRMIMGGEDHRKDIKINPSKNFRALEEYIQLILGENDYKITRKWDGPIIESVDGLPLIGDIKPHMFEVTALSGSGMTYAAVSALIIRDLILKKNNPYIDLYSIKRTTTLRQYIIKGYNYVQEFFGGAFKNFFK